jgi:RNA polymerase sigma factor (sigma-70 family)
VNFTIFRDLMDDELIKLVKTYRLTRGLAERLELAERIVPLIQRSLRNIVFKDIRPVDAEDVFQKVLAAVAANLGQFRGNSPEEFWGWCNAIARNKVYNQIEKYQTDRLQPMPDEELWQVLEKSVAPATLSAGDRHDLEYAHKMLKRSQPECWEYLWNHIVFGLNYAEIAKEQQLSYDGVRMKIGRCLELAQSLVA